MNTLQEPYPVFDTNTDLTTDKAAVCEAVLGELERYHEDDDNYFHLTPLTIGELWDIVGKKNGYRQVHEEVAAWLIAKQMGEELEDAAKRIGFDVTQRFDDGTTVRDLLNTVRMRTEALTAVGLSDAVAVRFGELTWPLFVGLSNFEGEVPGYDCDGDDMVLLPWTYPEEWALEYGREGVLRITNPTMLVGRWSCGRVTTEVAMGVTVDIDLSDAYVAPYEPLSVVDGVAMHEATRVQRLA